MTTLKIVSIPMPARVSTLTIGQRGSKYPLGQMEVGQAIVLDGIDPKKDHSKLSSAVANFRKANPGTAVKFAIRSFVEKDEATGVDQTRVGVWRTE
jgi:hypothetical protein